MLYVFVVIQAYKEYKISIIRYARSKDSIIDGLTSPNIEQVLYDIFAHASHRV